MNAQTLTWPELAALERKRAHERDGTRINLGDHVPKFTPNLIATQGKADRAKLLNAIKSQPDGWRELSKRTGLTHSSVRNHIRVLLHDGLIEARAEHQGLRATYWAKENN